MSRMTFIVQVEVDNEQYKHVEGSGIERELIAEDIASLLGESYTFEVVSIKSPRGERYI